MAGFDEQVGLLDQALSRTPFWEIQAGFHGGKKYSANLLLAYLSKNNLHRRTGFEFRDNALRILPSVTF
jgi:hypothetical protein